MPALAGAADLAAICGCLLYLALLVTASWMVGVLLGFANISVLGTHPLKNIATGALNAINKGLQDQIVATQDAVSTLWGGFTWLIREGGNGLGALAGATYGTFSYLWRTGIPAAVNALTRATSDLAKEAYDAAKSAGDTATSAGVSILHEAQSAIKTAEGYTDSAINLTHKYVDTQVAAAVASAGTTAGQLVAQAITLTTKDYNELKGDLAGIPDEIKAAVAKIPQGLGAGDVTNAIQSALNSGGAIYNEISQRISGLGGGVTEQDITAAIGAALAPGAAIYNEIKSLIPTVPGGLTVEDVTNAISRELAQGGSIAGAISNAVATTGAGVTESDVIGDITSALLPTGAIGLAIAAAVAGIAIPVPPGGITIPTPTIAQLVTGLAAVTTVVAGIEAISFIGGEECKGKVGQICNTESNAWTKLLEGAALVALDFNFTELVNACTAILPTVESAVTSFE